MHWWSTLAPMAAGATLTATGYVLSSPSLSAFPHLLVPCVLGAASAWLWSQGRKPPAETGPLARDVMHTPAPDAQAAPSTTAAEASPQYTDRALHLLGRVFEQSSSAMVISDAMDRIVLVNRAFEQLSGRKALELIGQPGELVGLTPLRPSHLEGIDKALREGTRWSGESDIEAASGQRHDLWLSVTALRDAEQRISHHTRVFQDVEPLKEQLRQMAAQARHDSLTGLPNRRAFGEHLFQALARTRRYPKTLAIMCVDLDGFKAVNDNHGHAVGDELLVQVARRLEACVRTTDTVCRVGGDEFMLILEGAGAPHEIQRIGYRVLRCLTESYVISGHHLRVTPSIGAVVHDGAEPDSVLVQRADAAMYAAKNGGKCRMVMDDGVTQGVTELNTPLTDSKAA